MLEDFEKKIIRLKKSKFFGVFLFMIFSFVVMFSCNMASSFKEEKQTLQNEYNKNMYEVVSYVSNIEVELEKLQITTTDVLKITTLADIWRKSNLAKSNLESFPTVNDSMQNVSKFLAQLSDFSYSLVRQIVIGNAITEEQYENIANMAKSSKEFSDVLSEIYNDLNSGSIKWDELSKSSNEKLDDADVSTSIDKINKTFQEYEGLIYDGAFSDHILSLDPKFLSTIVVTEENARERIYEILGKDNVEYVNYTGDSSGRIELYNYEIKLKNDENMRSISLTKRDAKLYLMVGNRDVLEENLSVDDAKDVGYDFLNSLGISDVVDTYYLKQSNIATINYAGKQGDVILYPDLIKVKIALDNGEILSVESQGYIFNHYEREDVTPTITMDEAMEKINKGISISSKKIAIIPTDSKSEILTYEFKGNIDDRQFIVYINAKTGNEEKILLLLDTEGGILTM